jgi:hypothetical protein
MKIFIVLANIALGLLLIFYGFNSQMYLYSVTHNPSYAGKSGAESFVQGIKDTLPQRVTTSILGIGLGIFAIVAALAFRKGKRWAMFVLPLFPLMLSLRIFLDVNSAPPAADALVAGPAILFALVLFGFFLLEALYMFFANRSATQA